MKKIILAIVFFATYFVLHAQKGTIDLTFNIGSGPDGNVSSIILQPDNKILVGGGFQNWDGVQHKRIVRLNPDGSTDASFAGNIVGNGDVMAMALQADGKIIIAGSFQQINGGTKNRIARLNSDGTVDATFNIGTGLEGNFSGTYVECLKLQPDGKILVGGAFTKYNGTTKNNIVRLNSDGSLDATWVSGGTESQNSVQDIEVLSDGKVLIGGTFKKYDGLDDFPDGATLQYFVRANTDGTLDPTFIPQKSGSTGVYDIEPMPDGRILLGGGTNPMEPIRRVNADGSTDKNFGIINGMSANIPDGYVASVIAQTNGEIVVSGNFKNIAIFDPITSKVETKSIAKIVGLTADGFLDTDFIVGIGCESSNVNFRADVMALQADGKILVGGINIEGYNGTPVNNIFRLNGSGGVSVSDNFTQNYSNITVYPNPTKETVTIGNLPNGSTVKITDIVGNTIYSSVINNEQTTINTTSFINGNYIIQIENNGVITNSKLVINK